MTKLSKIALASIMALSSGFISNSFAESAPSGQTAIVAETLTHIETALDLVNKSDFASAQLHLKAARASNETMPNFQTGVVKQANDSVIQGQIEAKKGNVEKSAAELKNAIKLYKSL